MATKITSGGVLIKGGHVVNDDISVDADVYVKDGIIAAVEPDLTPAPDTRVIDATGKMVIPGGIDPHVHLQCPLMGAVTVDDFYHGTRAALAGGTTMIMDFATPPRGTSLVNAYNKWMGWAKDKSCCDYGFHMIVSWWSDEVAKEMETIVKDYGINSFKMYMAYKDQLMLEDPDMYEVFIKCKELGALPLVHAENGHAIDKNAQRLIEMGVTGPEGHQLSRPEDVETEATHRAIMLASQVNCPLYIVHVMCKGSATAVADARRRGEIVFGEPTAAGLGCDGSNYYSPCWRHAAGHIVSPPLRQDPTTQTYLMDMLANNDLQLTATDNCTFTTEQRALGKDDFRKIPNGINGLEDRMSVVWEKGVVSGKLDTCRFVAITSSNAAKIFNIYPRKGRIAVGSDADVVVWNPSATRTISASTHNHACDFNVFEGMTCHGVPEVVISRGRVVKDEHGLHVEKGAGRYVDMPTFSPHVFSRVHVRDELRKPVPVKREPYVGPVSEYIDPRDVVCK